MIILDTNVVSELMRQRPDAVTKEWINRQPLDELWTTTVTVFEIYHGIEIHPDGKRQLSLRVAFEIALEDLFKNRILPFDFAAATEAAKIAKRRKHAGLASEIRDLQIAGIVASSGGALATRNTNDFEEAGVVTINPWNAHLGS